MERVVFKFSAVLEFFGTFVVNGTESPPTWHDDACNVVMLPCGRHDVWFALSDKFHTF